MDNYINQAAAAKIIGISSQRLGVLVKQKRFIKGKLKFNKHSNRKILYYKVEDVVEYAKNRASPLV
jgi:hypothetical protein